MDSTPGRGETDTGHTPHAGPVCRLAEGVHEGAQSQAGEGGGGKGSGDDAKGAGGVETEKGPIER